MSLSITWADCEKYELICDLRPIEHALARPYINLWIVRQIRNMGDETDVPTSINRHYGADFGEHFQRCVFFIRVSLLQTMLMLAQLNRFSMSLVFSAFVPSRSCFFLNLFSAAQQSIDLLHTALCGKRHDSKWIVKNDACACVGRAGGGQVPRAIRTLFFLILLRRIN